MDREESRVTAIKAAKLGITQKTFISRQTGSLAWPALRILPVYACYQTDAH